MHSNAYAALGMRFPELNATVKIEWLVDGNEQAVSGDAEKLSVSKYGTDWRKAVDDPEVDLVDICLPDALHYEVAKAALLAGKHVYCEKPFTNTVAEAEELVALAAQSKLITRVGHNFPVNPAHQLAKKLIQSGEIGEITMFRAMQHIDSHGDPNAPFIWRLDGKLAPTGIVGDTGSHLFAYADFLVGEVEELTAFCPTVISERPVVHGAVLGDAIVGEPTGEMVQVTNPDAGMVICRFKSGAIGTIDFSRIATGKKFVQRYEVYGTKGSITYDYDNRERLNLYKVSDERGQQGFRAIDVGPEFPEYASFNPLPNFGLGYNEIKMIEVSRVVESIASNTLAWPTFEDGKRIIALVEASMLSHVSRKWEKVQN